MGSSTLRFGSIFLHRSSTRRARERQKRRGPPRQRPAEFVTCQYSNPLALGSSTRLKASVYHTLCNKNHISLTQFKLCNGAYLLGWNVDRGAP
jgi:hypothetical protein